ncbi:hypothetical protein B296_00053615 [Ensete ventricosum]|uniref:Uncharacterized protein n=1 Tax=Ensete ventricosum TaxID=4639 RepID=A0A426XBC9_ENSVE|nr:hypothetical protein B296_00053615 [Ensete ventricosum]
MHAASPALTTSSGASGPVSCGCVSINPSLDTQWSFGSSFSSYASLSSPLPISSSPAPPTHYAYDIVI